MVEEKVAEIMEEGMKAKEIKTTLRNVTLAN